MSKILYIATSRLQPCSLFLAARDDTDIEVWDTQSRQQVFQFHSIQEGFRLALADDQTKCAAGSYRQGVALYNLRTGLEAWRRLDLHGLQFVQFSKGGECVFCGFENGPGQVLCADSGTTIRAWRGIRKLFESRYDNRILLHKGSKGYAIVDSEQGTPDVHVSSLKPGPLLDVAFSSRDLCLSEVTAVRCFDLAGLEVWRRSLPSNERMIGLSYQHQLDAYFGILSDLTSTETTLVKISGDDGSYKVVSRLGRLQQAGFCGDSKVVCTNGTLWDLATGELATRLWSDEPKSASEPEREFRTSDLNAAKNSDAKHLVDRLWGDSSGKS